MGATRTRSTDPPPITQIQQTNIAQVSIDPSTTQPAGHQQATRQAGRMGRSSASNESSGLRQRPSSSSLLGSGSTNNAAAAAHEGSSPPPPASSPVAAAGAAGGGKGVDSSSSPRKQQRGGEGGSHATSGTSNSTSTSSGGGGDRWTGLLAALWALLFLALCVNRQELWVVLAGLVGYACLCLLLDVVAIPPFWEDNNGPLKASQAARLSNGLVCVAHSIAMGLAAGACVRAWLVGGWIYGFIYCVGFGCAYLSVCALRRPSAPASCSHTHHPNPFPYGKKHTHQTSPGRLPPPQADHGLRLPPLRPVGQGLEAPLHEPALPLHARGPLRHAGGGVFFSNWLVVGFMGVVDGYIFL